MLSRIACVEDDDDIREILRIVLTDLLGAEARMFDNCDDALFGIPPFRPDLILLDPGMNRGMSGVELCAFLLDNPFLEGVPMAFLTSSALAHEVRALERLAPVLRKPFDPMALPGALRALHGAALRPRHAEILPPPHAAALLPCEHLRAS